MLDKINKINEIVKQEWILVQAEQYKRRCDGHLG